MRRVALWTSIVAASLIAALPSVGKQAEEPRLAEATMGMRLITQEQYVNTLQNVFGTGLEYRAQFPPVQRVEGLMALGSTSAIMTSAALDQYDTAARSIASQVVDQERRAFLIPCQPKKADTADDACAGQFLSGIGKTLFRRPMTSKEREAYLGIARDGAVAAKDFYAGVGVALASLLVAPDFLYATQPANVVRGERQLTPAAKATRMSLLLWNSYPDEELLRAAEKGELETEKGLARQVDRMLASPKLADGVRSFFDDMLEFEEFDHLTKDGNFYPAFTAAVTVDAKEQTLRTIVDHLVYRNQDYRDLFTTRKTFLTIDLGGIYGVPVRTEGGWIPFEFPPESPRAGILTHASFLALHAHPARSSATLRGKALRELFLCQKVPSPPANVDFGAVNDPSSPLRTARDRVNFHLENPVCAGCHKITDPMGLALENFDGAGQYRVSEGGVTIDPSGALDGKSFADVKGLSQALRDHPQLPRCAVRRFTSYALGRALTGDDRPWLEYAEGKFAASGYRVKDLLRLIATSQAFYAVPPPAEK